MVPDEPVQRRRSGEEMGRGGGRGVGGMLGGGGKQGRGRVGGRWGSTAYVLIELSVVRSVVAW